MLIFMIAAVTLDGFIARASSEISTSWTPKEDARFFSQRTKQAGVVVFGRTTFQTFGSRPLPERLNIVLTRDSELLLQPRTDQLWYTDLTPTALVEQLKSENRPELAVGGGSTLYAQFINERLINKAYLTTENCVFGTGIPLFGKPLVTEPKLELVEKTELTSHTLLQEFDVTY
jgi:dihydrofolate reductase